MNQVILLGNIFKVPEVRYTTGENQIAIARYGIAVRRNKDATDFINLVAYGKNAEFVEKYVTKGMRICVRGHIQTGSYEKDGKKVYTTDVVVEEHDFCESRREEVKAKPDDDGFFSVPDSVDDGGLPFV